METKELKKIKRTAAKWSKLLHYQTRPDGEGFYSFTDEALGFGGKPKPAGYEELSRIIHESGTDEDSAYRWTHEALEAYADIDPEDEYSADEVTDNIEADVYTSDLTGWLHRSNYNVEYLSEAISEYGEPESGFTLLAMAQSLAMREVYSAVLAALQEA